MQAQIDYDITLRDQVEAVGAVNVAEQLGLTRSGIFRMLKNNRRIYLKQFPDGWKYCEVKNYKRCEKKSEPSEDSL